MDNRSKKIIFASWVGIIANSLLAIIKVTVGIISGSMAVIADGIDTTSDVATYFISLFTAKIISKSPTEKFPYGYKRAETIAATVMSFVICFVGLQLLITTATKIFTHSEQVIPSALAIYVTIFSIIGKFILTLWQFKRGRILESSMLIANAKNMKNDILISTAVLIGLFFTIFLKMPIIDLILALIVSIWIIKVAVEIFIDVNTELMDGMRDTDIYKDILDIVNSIEGANNPHRIRIRKISNMYVIGLDIEVDGKMSVSDSHDLVEIVEIKLREKIKNIYDIVIHVEPLGNVEKHEPFGISEKNLNGYNND